MAKRPKAGLATEKKELIALMTWARYRGIHLVHHCNEGKRTPAEGSNLLKAGLSPGYPDVSLSEARGGYFGLYIELKQNRTYTPSEQKTKTWIAQREWLTRLANEHYYACMAYGWDNARKIIELYLSWPRTTFLSLVNALD